MIGRSVAVASDHSASVTGQQIAALEAGSCTGQYKPAADILAVEGWHSVGVAAGSAAGTGMTVAGHRSLHYDPF